MKLQMKAFFNSCEMKKGLDCFPFPLRAEFLSQFLFSPPSLTHYSHIHSPESRPLTAPVGGNNGTPPRFGTYATMASRIKIHSFWVRVDIHYPFIPVRRCTKKYVRAWYVYYVSRCVDLVTLLFAAHAHLRHVRFCLRL